MQHICINLKRRPDRKESMIKKFQKAGITNYEFFEAIDGKMLQPTDPILKLFKNIDSKKNGVIGCAASHINLMKKMVIDKYNHYIVLEDDADFADDYLSKLNQLANKITVNMDIIFLGYTMPKDDPNRIKYFSRNTEIEIYPLNGRLYGGGTFGYIISKIAAKKFLVQIQKNGVRRAIDFTIIDSNLNLYESQPFLITSLSSYQYPDLADSDINLENDRIIEFYSQKSNKWIYAIVVIIVIVILTLTFILIKLKQK